MREKRGRRDEVVSQRSQVWDMEERVTERDEDELKWQLDPLGEIKIGDSSV